MASLLFQLSMSFDSSWGEILWMCRNARSRMIQIFEIINPNFAEWILLTLKGCSRGNQIFSQKPIKNNDKTFRSLKGSSSNISSKEKRIIGYPQPSPFLKRIKFTQFLTLAALTARNLLKSPGFNPHLEPTSILPSLKEIKLSFPLPFQNPRGQRGKEQIHGAPARSRVINQSYR